MSASCPAFCVKSMHRIQPRTAYGHRRDPYHSQQGGEPDHHADHRAASHALRRRSDTEIHKSSARRECRKTQIELLIACVLDFTVRLLYTFIC